MRIFDSRVDKFMCKVIDTYSETFARDLEFEILNYFTDAETVNKCRKENGDVDVDKLLQALQMDPGNNKDWTLREYVYRNNK